MNERMIKLMEEQNALLREMNGKLDDVIRITGLGTMTGLSPHYFTDETKAFIEGKSKQVYGKKENL